MLPFSLCHSEQPFVLSCPAFLQQIEVVNTFKSGTSFQGAGALRRQSSTTSQTQDVTNVSSPSHVSLSNALSSPTSTTAATAPPTTGRESELCPSACLLSLLQGCHPPHHRQLKFEPIIAAIVRLASLKTVVFSPAICFFHFSSVFLLFILEFRFTFIFPPMVGCTVLSLVDVCLFSQSARSAGLRVKPTA